MKKILFILGLSAFLFSSCGSKPKTDDGVSQKIESDISEAVEETKENVEENIELTDNSEILKSLNSAREPWRMRAHLRELAFCGGKVIPFRRFLCIVCEYGHLTAFWHLAYPLLIFTGYTSYCT